MKPGDRESSCTLKRVDTEEKRQRYHETAWCDIGVEEGAPTHDNTMGHKMNDAPDVTRLTLIIVSS